MNLKKYRKRPNQFVIAVQINLETEGMSYTKWGNEQHCKAGDWLINSQGECYTVEEESFAKTYSEIRPGIYLKTAPVWACVVESSGKVGTKEGFSDYSPGDYRVANNEDGTDAYAVSKEDFERKYEPLG